MRLVVHRFVSLLLFTPATGGVVFSSGRRVICSAMYSSALGAPKKESIGYQPYCALSEPVRLELVYGRHAAHTPEAAEQPRSACGPAILAERWPARCIR